MNVLMYQEFINSVIGLFVLIISFTVIVVIVLRVLNTHRICISLTPHDEDLASNLGIAVIKFELW